ncbi:hypothetical protein ACHAXS_005650 [Conticribra weissflogii]
MLSYRLFSRHFTCVRLNSRPQSLISLGRDKNAYNVWSRETIDSVPFKWRLSDVCSSRSSCLGSMNYASITPSSVYFNWNVEHWARDEMKSRNRPLELNARFLTSASTSSISSDVPDIKVTVTTAESSQSNTEIDDDSELRPNIDDGPQLGSQSSSGPNLKKTEDQEIEERILEIQSKIRAQHRHADYASALTTSTELLALSKDHFGELHPATASAYNNVGLMNKYLGNYADAKEAYHESLRIYGEVCGKDHASYAAALSNLGMLERGRVIESEAEETDEGVEKNDGGASADNDNDAVSKTKPKLSALERIQLNETAIEYLDEAYRIRVAELGIHHPHTISSRSQLGSAMAASVISERKGKLSGLVEGELRRLKTENDVKDATELEEYVPVAVARAAARSTSQSKLSQRRWDAAEDHLRGALSTAVDNPRGERVRPLEYLPTSSDSENYTNYKRQGLTLPPKNDRPLSKKDKRKAGKERKREKRRANMNLLRGNLTVISDESENENGKTRVKGIAGKVTTLSAATAAQNLAVFLKRYSDWMRLTLVDDGNIGDGVLQQEQQKRVRINQIMLEARHLYESALHVRSSILVPSHPEVVATKYSLAELLDSPKVLVSPSMKKTGKDEEERIDEQRANKLREEILSAYEVTEREDKKSQL